MDIVERLKAERRYHGIGALDAVLVDAAAEIACLRAERAWRGIDSAPRDMRSIWVWANSSVAIAFWGPYAMAWLDATGIGALDPQPILWQPLPTPPAPEAE